MSRTRSVAGRLAATVLVATVIGCAVPQSAVQQGGDVETFDERIASLTPAEREELQRSMEMPSAYDPETRTARDAFFAWVAWRDARDAQPPAMEIPRMEDLPPHEWATYGYTPPADAHDR